MMVRSSSESTDAGLQVVSTSYRRAPVSLGDSCWQEDAGSAEGDVDDFDEFEAYRARSYSGGFTPSMKPRPVYRPHHHHEHHHQHHQQQQLPRVRTEIDPPTPETGQVATRPIIAVATMLATIGQCNAEGEERHRHAVTGSGENLLKPSNTRLVVNNGRVRPVSNSVESSFGNNDDAPHPAVRCATAKNSKTTCSKFVQILLSGSNNTTSGKTRQPDTGSGPLSTYAATSAGDLASSWNIGEMRPRIGSAPASKLRRPVMTSGRSVGDVLPAHNSGHDVHFGVNQTAQQRKQQQPMSHVLRKVKSSTLLRYGVQQHQPVGTSTNLTQSGGPHAVEQRPNPSCGFRPHDAIDNRHPGVYVDSDVSSDVTTSDRSVQGSCKSIGQPAPPISRHRVLVTGQRGVGKSTIVESFLRSDRSNTYADYGDGNSGPEAKGASILLDGDITTLELIDWSDNKADSLFVTSDDISAYVIVYSVEDRGSFEAAADRLYELRHEEAIELSPVVVILVANKVDLVRTRVVLEQEGRSAAVMYSCKYVEVSAAMDLNVDHLFVGIVRQIRLQQLACNGSASSRHRVKQQRHGKVRSPVVFDHSTAHSYLIDDDDDVQRASSNSDACCLIGARNNVLNRLCRGLRRASKSCVDLYVL